jgi:cell division protein FtsB
MRSHTVTIALLLLLAYVHGNLWIGRGSVQEVAAMRTKLADQKAQNLAAKRQNATLAAEVRDLQEGLGMVEEKARKELGLVMANEVFVQLVPKP